MEIPYDTIDMDFMNLNQTAHGGREYGFMCTRLDVKREVIVGYYEHEEVIEKIINVMLTNGFSVLGLDFSPVKGPEGNIEYLMHIYKAEMVSDEYDAEAIVKANAKHQEQYSPSREWMKFILTPIFWGVGIISGLLAIAMFVSLCQNATAIFKTATITDDIALLFEFLITFFTIGFCVFSIVAAKEIDKENDYRIKSVFCFVIAPDMRRNGIAKRLLEYVCKDATKDGFDFVEAYPNKDYINEARDFMGPKGLYDSFGFDVCSVAKNKLVMRKKLK